MKYVKYLLTFIVLSAAAGILAIAGMYFYIRPQLPSVDVLKDVHLQTPMSIYTRDNKLISQYGVKKRIPLTLEQIPKKLKQAVIATEDSRFYEHPGIDPIGVARAFVNLVLTGEKGQGASTLTMQLAREYFLTRDKRYMRKIKEVFIAWHIERMLSKNEILELYLNKYELGHRAFGVGAAAQVYYGKEVTELTLAQIATIAGLLQAPSVLNPISRPERSVKRRRIVLLRMLDEGYISEDDFHQAANAPVTASRHGAEIEVHAPYLADMIYREMVGIYGKEEAETGGYRVYATVNSKHQLAARQAVRRNLHDYDERHGYRGPIKQLWKPKSVISDNPDLVTTSFDDPAWTEQAMSELLKQTSAYAPLVPAIVTTVNEKSIQIFDKQGEYRTIDWDGLAWARPFIDDNTQGEPPEVAGDIVTEGALVWIRFQQENQLWQLAQFPAVTGALVALAPYDGAIQAIVGGYSFSQSQFNRATQAKRQVGSNIKPFIYSAALDQGFTIASIINDAPINQGDRGSGIAWRPQNSDKVYSGPIRMRRALGRSKNVVSVRLLRAVGLDNVINYLTNFGFDPKELNRDESLALGSASLTPIEVARGFATIRNGGFLIDPYVIKRIDDIHGNLVWQANPAVACKDCLLAQHTPEPDSPYTNDTGTQASINDKPATLVANHTISEQNAFLVSEMMRTAIRGGGNWSKKTYWQGTGWRARNVLGRNDIAGKTGTTNDAKDTWFSGFSADLVATSWVGFDDMSRALGRTSRNQYLINKNPQKYNWLGNAMVGGEDGARVAQPAWIRYMQQVMEGVPQQEINIPEDIITVRIDRHSGKLTRRTDHTSRFEYFVRGTEPTTYVLENELIDPYLQQKTGPKPEDDIF